MFSPVLSLRKTEKKRKKYITTRILTLIQSTDLIQISPNVLVLVCVYLSSIQRYHLCSFVSPHTASRHAKTLLWPFCNRTPKPCPSLIFPPFLKLCYLKICGSCTQKISSVGSFGITFFHSAQCPGHSYLFYTKVFTLQVAFFNYPNSKYEVYSEDSRVLLSFPRKQPSFVFSRVEQIA